MLLQYPAGFLAGVTGPGPGISIICYQTAVPAGIGNCDCSVNKIINDLTIGDCNCDPPVFGSNDCGHDGNITFFPSDNLGNECFDCDMSTP